MSRLQEIKNGYARELGYHDFEGVTNQRSVFVVESMLDEVARRYATEMVRHNLERAAEQAAIEAESPLSGKTIHGSINSEDPQWVARVNRESITSLEIELI